MVYHRFLFVFHSAEGQKEQLCATYINLGLFFSDQSGARPTWRQAYLLTSLLKDQEKALNVLYQWTPFYFFEKEKYEKNKNKRKRREKREFHETCHSVTSHCTGQFTPKMKANAEPRLLSSLVWIDSGVVVVSKHRLESFPGVHVVGM